MIFYFWFLHAMNELILHNINSFKVRFLKEIISKTNFIIEKSFKIGQTIFQLPYSFDYNSHSISVRIRLVFAIFRNFSKKKTNSVRTRLVFAMKIGWNPLLEKRRKSRGSICLCISILGWRFRVFWKSNYCWKSISHSRKSLSRK